MADVRPAVDDAPMSSRRPQALTPGRPAGPASSDQRLEELLRGIHTAQRQVDAVLAVLHELAVSVRDRPRRQLPQGTGEGRMPGRSDTGGSGAPGGMRGWGH